jgi:hypothetical protein
MSQDTKTVEDWEAQRGMLIELPLGTEITYAHDKGDGTVENITSKFDLNEQLSSDEFFEKFYNPRIRPHVLSVNHGDRKDWLEVNGYETSRDNMLRKRLLSKSVWDAAANR